MPVVADGELVCLLQRRGLLEASIHCGRRSPCWRRLPLLRSRSRWPPAIVPAPGQWAGYFAGKEVTDLLAESESDDVD